MSQIWPNCQEIGRLKQPYKKTAEYIGGLNNAT